MAGRGLSWKEVLDPQYILKEELIEAADRLDWGAGGRLELVCLSLGPIPF